MSGRWIGKSGAPGNVLQSGVFSLDEMNEAKLRKAWWTDPYWANVSALLHFDGTDASTTFTDEKGHTFTAVGNAQIDTAQSKWGGSSLLLDGSGDWIESAASSDWSIPTGPWAIDGWVRINSLAANVSLCSRRSGGTNGWAVEIGSDGSIYLRANIGGSWNDFWMHSATGVLTTGAWYYVGVKRVSSAWTIWVSGTQVASLTNAGSMSDEAQPLRIGSSNNSGEASFNGWIDDFRFTKADRDLSVVPTGPFPSP